MSQFASDFITYLAAAGIGAASLALTVEPQTPPNNVVASAATDLRMIRDIAAESPTDAGSDFTSIPEAKLLPVTFTRDGLEKHPALPEVAANTPSGTVTGTVVNLRAGPGTSFNVVGKGREGQQFALTGKTDGVWVELSDPATGGTAWIHGNYFNSDT